MTLYNSIQLIKKQLQYNILYYSKCKASIGSNFDAFSAG